jgi:hypothetical protein
MQCRKNSLLRHGPATNRRPFQLRAPSFLADRRKGLLCALILIAPIAQASAVVETNTIRIEKLDMGNALRGRNKFSAAVQNKTDSVLTLVLDLRADPGLWLRKSQRQFVYLLQSGARQVIDAEYEFIHMSPEAFLRVQFYFPIVAATGVTELSKPFFEQVYPVGVGNKDVDYDLSQFHKREGRHFLIYYFPDSLAAHEMDRIVEERDRGFEKIAIVLGVSSERKIRLFLFPDGESKEKETGHHGAGWAFGNNVIEVYNEKTKLDPYHETAHILSEQLGSPAALFNEGFAVYVSEFLGGDALREPGSPGKTCDQAVMETRAKGNFITLERLLSFDEIGSEATSPSTSYPEACSAVRFLVGRYGLDKLREAFATISAGDQKAFQKVFGASTTDIERIWLSSLPGSR